MTPLVNIFNPLATMAGVPGSPYEAQKVPYALLSSTAGVSGRPLDVQAQKIKALKQRLTDLQNTNRTALQDKLNFSQREQGVPLQVKLAQFKKYLGL